MWSGQDFSSICLILPHFLRLTHFLDRFCLHFLSQSLHELHGEKRISFLWDDALLSPPTPLTSLSLLLTSRWLKSVSSFSLVVLLEICFCWLLKSTSFICNERQNVCEFVGSFPNENLTISSEKSLKQINNWPTFQQTIIFFVQVPNLAFNEQFFFVTCVSRNHVPIGNSIPQLINERSRISAPFLFFFTIIKSAFQKLDKIYSFQTWKNPILQDLFMWVTKQMKYLFESFLTSQYTTWLNKVEKQNKKERSA